MKYWILFISFFLLFVRPLVAQPQKVVVPKDFRLVAYYAPGLSKWKPWETTIGASGEVSQKVLKSNSVDWDEKRLSPLSQRDLIELIEKIEGNQFFRLSKAYDGHVSDMPASFLEITMGGRRHKVSVRAANAVEEKDEVERFLRIWELLLRKVPSPNEKQNPK